MAAQCRGLVAGSILLVGFVVVGCGLLVVEVDADADVVVVVVVNLR